jgi:hypothetical protein
MIALLLFTSIGIGLLSCNEEGFGVTPTTSDRQNLDSESERFMLSREEMKTLAYEKAKLELEQYLETSAGGTRDVRALVDNDSNKPWDSPCNCFYEVLDAKFINPPGYPKLDIAFHTPANDCNPNNPWDCTYFSGIYNDFYPDCVTIPFPECVDVWSSIPPSPSPTLFPFNCSVDRFSAFVVSFDGIALDDTNCVLFNYLKLASITFKIYCVESEPECGGYGYVSDPITISFSNSGGSTNYFQSQIVSLGGDCGCFPEAVE